MLTEELEILKIERKIEGEIKSQVKKNQKELYLTEQLKAIRKDSATATAAVPRSTSCAWRSRRRACPPKPTKWRSANSIA